MTRQPPFQSRCPRCGDRTEDDGTTLCDDCSAEPRRASTSEGSDIPGFLLYLALAAWFVLMALGIQHLIGVVT